MILVPPQVDGDFDPKDGALGLVCSTDVITVILMLRRIQGNHYERCGIISLPASMGTGTESIFMDMQGSPVDLVELPDITEHSWYIASKVRTVCLE